MSKWVLCFAVTAGLFVGTVIADVSVVEEPIRDKHRKLTGWSAVRMDSGRKIYEIRFDGHHLGLGPTYENWYGGGFLVIAADGVKSEDCDAVLTVLKRGPDAAVVSVTWNMPAGPAVVLLELRDSDDKLLLTVKPPKAAARRVQLLCYPSAFAGGYRKGKAIRRRRGITAARELRLNGELSVKADLEPAEPWVLFMDDYFDPAQKRGVGPCAALYFPREVSSAAAAVGNYSCYLFLEPAPGTAELHVVLWDFTGMANAQAARYMKALELVPAGETPKE